MTEQPTVFLSYAREDRARVEQVYDSLKAEGFNPWLDTRDIMPGQEWSQVIGRAIRAADFMLVFLSRRSISKRGYVQREIRAALSMLSNFRRERRSSFRFGWTTRTHRSLCSIFSVLTSSRTLVGRRF